MLPNQSLSKRPSDPIGNHVEQAGVSPDATYLDLMGLPANVLAWLFTRPLKQVNTAAMVAKYGHIASGALLKHDENVLVLTTQSGVKLSLYPDGGMGSNGIPVEVTPEGIQSLGGGSAPMAPMGMTNLVGIPNVENPLDGGSGPTLLDPDPEISVVSNGDIVEEPMVGDDAGESDIDQWIDSLEMELKPEERSQAAERVVGILDSVGHANGN